MRYRGLCLCRPLPDYEARRSPQGAKNNRSPATPRRDKQVAKHSYSLADLHPRSLLPGSVAHLTNAKKPVKRLVGPKRRSRASAPGSRRHLCRKLGREILSICNEPNSIRPSHWRSTRFTEPTIVRKQGKDVNSGSYIRKKHLLERTARLGGTKVRLWGCGLRPKRLSARRTCTQN